jgi:hypothetical protein
VQRKSNGLGDLIFSFHDPRIAAPGIARCANSSIDS